MGLKSVASMMGTVSTGCRVRVVGKVSVVLGMVVMWGCIDVGDVRRAISGDAGPPSAIEIVTGDDQVGVAGTSLPGALVVRLTDAAGQPVEGRPVSFRVAEGDGSLFAPTAVTDRDGRAATIWTLGPAASEPQTVHVTLVVPETGVGLVAEFNAEGLVGTPAVATLRGGDQQTGGAGVVLPNVLEIEVRDGFANPVPGVRVGWRVAAGGGTVATPGAVTDGSGIARTRWSLGPEADLQRVVVDIPGVEPVTFVAHMATTMLEEDFEHGLASWTGRGTGPHSGVIVADPLDDDNQVLTFTRGATAGDIFSQQIGIDRNAEYELSFDYLGLPLPGSAKSNHGGFIGIAEAVPGRHRWIAGTDPPHTANILVDDGTWHSYSFRIRPASYVRAPNGLIRVMLEDSEAPGRVPGVAGDAFFDNVRFNRVPR